MLAARQIIVRLRLPTPVCLAKRRIHKTDPELQEKEVQEITIPVPWGHIAGKWWGPSDVKPILGLHGWQDNAGTWDTLAPLLPPNVSLLAIDSPGHGLSSHFPRGIPYRFTDQVFVLRRILHHFQWETVSFLSHSLGAIQSVIFAAVHPEMVENLMVVDAIKPLSLNPAQEVSHLGSVFDKYLKEEERDEKNRPVYTYDTAIEKLYDGMIGKSLTKESCKVLLKRGLKQSGDGYQFTRDPLLKSGRLGGWLHEYLLYMARQISCNVLVIKANPGLNTVKYEPLKYLEEFVGEIQKSAKKFECKTVEGMHHVHLNNPERVAPVVINFLKSCEAGSSQNVTKA